MSCTGFEFEGRITGTKGALLTAELLGASLGAWCEICAEKSIKAQIVNFHESEVHLAPLGEIEGLTPYTKVKTQNESPSICVGDFLLGKTVNALGIPHVYENQSKSQSKTFPIYSSPPNFVDRAEIFEQIETGIKVIDTFCPIGFGQRMGVIAQAGVGKSTLLNQIAKLDSFDVAVVGLIGERGREVQEFINSLEEFDKCVLVVSTSDEPPILRATAPYTATAIAEYFRDRGKRVLLIIDSLTRTARALRDVGLSVGEIPVRHGYTPSVYSALPRLIERAGNTNKGSITALYSLLGSEEFEDPLSEEVKSLLDGHIMLSSSVAQQGIRPSVDILRSLSRLSEKLLPEDVRRSVSTLLRLHQRITRDRDIITFGGVPDNELKLAIELEASFINFRNQGLNDFISKEISFERIRSLVF